MEKSLLIIPEDFNSVMKVGNKIIREGVREDDDDDGS